MVCRRCFVVIETELKQLGLHHTHMQLGEITFQQPISLTRLELLKKALKKYGFELITDKRIQIIEQIKTLAISYVFKLEKEEKLINFSYFLELHIYKDYSYLSNLFSEMEGTTIEKYLINLKIERVKELLVYDEMTLSEIAFEIGYSSVAHLSNQFKKTTGLTPSYFKQLKDKKRQSLEDI